VTFVDRVLARKPEATEARFGVPVDLGQFQYGGNTYPFGLQTTMPTSKVEPVENNFTGYVHGAYKRGGVVAACVAARMHVLGQLRFQWQRFRGGRPEGFFADQDLAILERPWRGGTTQNLVSRMESHDSLAGNAYVLRRPARLRVLRPDWVSIVMGTELETDDPMDADVLGYLYTPPGHEPRMFAASEVAHYAPRPDPEAEYRGMSWLTPVLRNISSHQAAAEHKWNFFAQGATPNMIIRFDPKVGQEAIDAFRDRFLANHEGVWNSYRTLFLGGGADATVVGKDFQQMDFKAIQGVDEDMIAANAGVPVVLLQFPEGLQGSSLNQGNYASAKRQFADTTIAYLASEAASSLESILPSHGGGVRLWWDARDVPFFRQDAKDEAEIHSAKSAFIRRLVDGGFDPDSVVAAADSWDETLLVHTGLLSVQLQKPGTPDTSTE